MSEDAVAAFEAELERIARVCGIDPAAELANSKAMLPAIPFSTLSKQTRLTLAMIEHLAQRISDLEKV